MLREQGLRQTIRRFFIVLLFCLWPSSPAVPFSEACPEGQYAEQYLPRAANLVLLFHFSEGNGATSFVDSSGNGNLGTCGVSCPTPGLPGAVGTAILASGATGNYVSVNDAATLDVADITISAWVNLTGQTGDGCIATKGTGGGGEVFSLDTSGGDFRFYFWKGGNSYVAQTTTSYLGGWKHVVATYNGTNQIVFVDGIQQATNDAGQGALATNTHVISIGARQSGTTNYDYTNSGLIDEVMIYNVALTRSEIRTLYRCGKQRVARTYPDVTPPPPLLSRIEDFLSRRKFN